MRTIFNRKKKKISWYGLCAFFGSGHIEIGCSFKSRAGPSVNNLAQTHQNICKWNAAHWILYLDLLFPKLRATIIQKSPPPPPPEYRATSKILYKPTESHLHWKRIKEESRRLVQFFHLLFIWNADILWLFAERLPHIEKRYFITSMPGQKSMGAMLILPKTEFSRLLVYHFLIVNDTAMSYIVRDTAGQITALTIRTYWFYPLVAKIVITLITRYMGPTCGPPKADRTQVGLILVPWILLSGSVCIIDIYVCTRAFVSVDKIR